MRQHILQRRATRLWRSLVAIRFERFQGRIAGAYFARVSYPLQVWQAFGSPAEFTPRLPWWQPFAFAWLVGSGWLPRRSSHQQFAEPY